MREFIDALVSTTLAILDKPIFNAEFFGNSVRRYLIALVFFLVLYGSIYALRYFLFTRLKSLFGKQGSRRSRLIKSIKGISPFFFLFLALYPAIRFLHLPANVDKAANVLLTLLTLIQAVRFAHLFVEFTFRGNNGKKDETMFHAVKLAATLVLWSLGILLVLSNLGYNVTTLLASLGIGGIAVAFAAQGILSDLFASYSIYFDKPFKIGDYIVIGKDNGTVQKVGLKTTRILTLQGQELVVSNKELTSARIDNYARMTERRVVLQFGVDYGTPLEKLERIPEYIKKIVEESGQTRFERTHMYLFGEWGIHFETIYFVLSPDYNLFMDIQHAVDIGILRCFEVEDIYMAIPGQSLYLLSRKNKTAENEAS